MRDYRLHLIKPTSLSGGRPVRLEKLMMPTRALPYLAGMTPPHYQVEIIDDSLEEPDYDAKVDLVGITTLIHLVPRAIQIADEFRKRGVKVVMGGPGASAVEDLVSPHVDSLVIGEAEEAWPRLLTDFEAGNLQKTYQSSEPHPLTGLAHARFDLVKLDKYRLSSRAASGGNHLRLPVETSRGCPHHCDYCFVSRYFGRKMRFRPIEEVVSEILAYANPFIFFVDDNIAANPERAKALFRALMPLRIRWVGQFTTLAARDPELLDLAARSGCLSAFIGLESISEDSLGSVGKKFNLSQDVSTTLRAFRNAGIEPQVSLIFGFDTDTPARIQQTIDFMTKEQVHLLFAFLLTPLPGTALHQRFMEEGRILLDDLSLYDTQHVVHRHPSLTPQELEDLFWSAYGRFYGVGSILRRFSDLPQWLAKGRLRTCMHNLVGNLVFKRMINNRMHPLTGGIPRRDGTRT